MIRSVGIALVIWGLIVQPLIAGVPIKMLNGSSHIEVALDFGVDEYADESQSPHHHNIQATTKTSCHDEIADSESSSSRCDNCGIDCMNSGMCATFCALSGHVLNLESKFSLDRPRAMPFFEIAELYDPGFPSYIYYPPEFS